jgi:hypothetical protein
MRCHCHWHLDTSYTPYLIQCTLTHIAKQYQSNAYTRWVQFTSLIPSLYTVLTGHTSFTLEVFRACPSPAVDETDESALFAAESTGTAAAACSTALRRFLAGVCYWHLRGGMRLCGTANVWYWLIRNCRARTGVEFVAATWAFCCLALGCLALGCLALVACMPEGTQAPQSAAAGLVQ